MAVLCLACNYSLNALPVPRCPECGRAFDPRDPATFNAARPLNRPDRAVLAARRALHVRRRGGAVCGASETAEE